MPKIASKSQSIVTRRVEGDARTTTIRARTEGGELVYRECVTDYSKSSGQWTPGKWFTPSEITWPSAEEQKRSIFAAIFGV